jgi:Cu(I)/Ag(I) efflux system membrane fusion protein/cobalt-zinc-cadmium efflux system membrane fusion protein
MNQSKTDPPLAEKNNWIKYSIIFIAVIVIIGGTVTLLYHTVNKSISEQKEIQMYQCPMHPDYISDKPGNCPICGMELVPVKHQQTEQPQQKSKKILYYRDPMNPSYTSDKPGKAPDGMDLVPVYAEEGSDKGVKIDPVIIQNIGVQTETVKLRNLTKEIRTSASVQADERRVFSVTTKIMGYIEKLYVNYTGQEVKKGQPLFDLYIPDLMSAQAEYLQAYRNSKAGADPGQLLQSTRQRLLNWDLPESEIAEIESRGTPKRAITFYSPVTGIVTEKMVIEGQSIEPGMHLYLIVDFSTVWILCNIYQQDIPFIHRGQQAHIELDFLPGMLFTGTITYIAPQLDTESRTLTVRVELENTPDLLIKPGMLATARLTAPASNSVLAVSEQAVIRSGTRNIIIVSKGGGYFEPRDVKIGFTAGGFTQISEGLKKGETIVVSSQFLIDSESNLKSAVMKMTSGTSSSSKPSQSDTVMPAISEKPIHTEQSAKKSEVQQQLYTCPMHPEIISDKPGNCPICGMKLIPKKENR